MTLVRVVQLLSPLYVMKRIDDDDFSRGSRSICNSGPSPTRFGGD